MFTLVTGGQSGWPKGRKAFLWGSNSQEPPFWGGGKLQEVRIKKTEGSR